MGNVLKFSGSCREIPHDAANFAPRASPTVDPKRLSLEAFGDIPLNAAYHYAPEAIRNRLPSAADRQTLLITAGALASLGKDVEGATLAWLAGYQSASVIDVRRFLKQGEVHLASVVQIVKQGGDDVAIEASCRRTEAHLYCACQMLPEDARHTLHEALDRAAKAPLRDRPQRVISAYGTARDLARS